jgi:hypothetical protein
VGDIVAAGMVKHARLLLSIAPISNADPDHLPPRITMQPATPQG